MNETPRRKPNRLRNYDYSQNGAYFITICTKNRKNLFGEINVGANCVRQKLSNIGKIINTEIVKLSNTYNEVIIDFYVVMPNHIHMIIVIQRDQRTQFAPTISRIIKQFKGAVTKQLGFSVWQKSFHDHIIRNINSYVRIAEYIDNNPFYWTYDCYHENNITRTNKNILEGVNQY